MLMLLRITVGWHFLYSGLWKLNEGDFSSAGFLSQAKGPLVEEYHKLIPDYNGFERLDVSKNVSKLESYAGNFAMHYQLNDEQRKQKDDLVAKAVADVRRYLGSIDADIQNYRSEVERLSKARKEPGAWTIPYMQKRNWDKQKELQDQVRPWLDEVQAIHDRLQENLEALLSKEQQARGNIPQPIDQMVDMNKFIIYTNIAIGVCLIVGLFTRLAALGGGVFLALVVAAQPDWPGLYPPPHPSAGQSLVVTKEFIEMMVLFTLATLPVGRWGGLDFLVHHILVRPLFGRKES